MLVGLWSHILVPSLFSLLCWNSWCPALGYTPLHPYGGELEHLKQRGQCILFSVVFTPPPTSHHGKFWLPHVISPVVTNTGSPVGACQSIWLDRFLGTQKEDERGPLSIQTLWREGFVSLSPQKQAKPSLHIHPSTIQAAIWFPYFVIRFLCNTLSSQLYNCRTQYSYCLHVNLATRLSFKLLQGVNTSVHPQNVRFQNVWFQNVRFQNVRFQNVRLTKRQVYKTSGFKTSGFKTSSF